MALFFVFSKHKRVYLYKYDKEFYMLLTEISKQTLQRLYNNADFKQSDKQFLQQDTGFFSDAMGKDWIHVKNTDYYSLVLAALDGMFNRYVRTAALIKLTKEYENINLEEIDTAQNLDAVIDKFGNDLSKIDISKYLNEETCFKPFYEAFLDNDITTLAKFNEFFSNKANLMRFVRRTSSKDDSSEIMPLVNDIVKFLQDAAETKFVTVYRGISIDHNKLLEWYKHDKLLKTNPLRILKYIDNTAKEFNSYSTDISVAEEFAKHTQDGKFYNDDLSKTPTHDYIIISGKAAKHNINFAFSAYLAGKSLSAAEQELSINSYEPLTDIKVEQYKFNLNVNDNLFDVQKRFGKCIAQIDNVYVFKNCITDSELNVIVPKLSYYKETSLEHTILCTIPTDNKFINKHFILNTVTLQTSGNAECKSIYEVKQPYILNKQLCYFKDIDDRLFFDAEMQLILSSDRADFRYYVVTAVYDWDVIPFTASEGGKVIVYADKFRDKYIVWLDSVTLQPFSKHTNIINFKKYKSDSNLILARCIEPGYKYGAYRLYNVQTDELGDIVQTV